MSDALSERRLRRRQSELSGESTPLPPDVPSAHPLADEIPPAASALAAGGSWLPLDDYARSGLAIEVRSADGRTAEAFLVSSRRYDHKAMRWVPVQIWRMRNASGTRLTWTPDRYRPLQMVVYQPPRIDP